VSFIVLHGTMPIIAPRLHSTPFARLDKPQSYTDYPPAKAILLTPPGISLVAEWARSDPNFLSTSFERTKFKITSGQTSFITPSAGCNATKWILIAWSPSFCNEIELVLHPYRCQLRASWCHRFLIQLHGNLREIHTAADIRCIILRV
jgi:hypothetical protein